MKRDPEMADHLDKDFPAPRKEPSLAKFKKGDTLSSLPKKLI